MKNLADFRDTYQTPLPDLLFLAASVHRQHHDPADIQRCVLLSIKTGGCPEDCGYCAQSARFKTGVEAVPLMTLEAVREKAVRANPRLAEAWYELGRRKVKRAVILIRTDEGNAVQMFREGLIAEQEARHLINEGKVIVWSTAEQGDATLRLDTDLQNVDEAMASPDALLGALRQRTY